MKHIPLILGIIGAICGIVLLLALINYTNNAVEAGNVCKTIYGCFGLWIWFNICKKEKK